MIVLHDLHLVIEPGQTIALVGPTGAGKSSITNLIARLYDVTNGAVLIDGIDVRTVAQRSLRQQTGIVPQAAQWCNLSNTNLVGGYFVNAPLAGASLKEVSFAGANLTGTLRVSI